MTPVKFRSNLPQMHAGLDNMAEAILEELAEEVTRAARRRIARDTGRTERSIRWEKISDTLVRVGAGEKPGLYLEIAEHLQGAYEWLTPSIENAQTVAQAIATAAARAEARKISLKAR